MDKLYMQQALDLAEKGKGFTSPNPLVGAIIVKNGEIIGQGYHERYGQAHAEVNAVRSATESVEGSTVYVTLEPCSHHGKTPPCADLLIQEKVKRVVIAARDPNPLVSGKGIQKLKAAGIDVITGVLEKQSNKLNEVFIHYITSKTPFILLKYAMSLDGKIATRIGKSQWISSESSRAHAHGLRGEYSGIMVGINTVIADDPLLTCRVKDYSNPIRIILDSTLRIPLDAKVVKDTTTAPTIVVTTEQASQKKGTELIRKGVEIIRVPERNGQVDLKHAMQVLGEKGIDGILLEGGGTVNAVALEEGIVSKVLVYIAPKIVGGKEAITPVSGLGIAEMCEAYALERLTTKRMAEDIIVEGYIERGKNEYVYRNRRGNREN